MHSGTVSGWQTEKESREIHLNALFFPVPFVLICRSRPCLTPGGEQWNNTPAFHFKDKRSDFIQNMTFERTRAHARLTGNHVRDTCAETWSDIYSQIIVPWVKEFARRIFSGSCDQSINQSISALSSKDSRKKTMNKHLIHEQNAKTDSTLNEFKFSFVKLIWSGMTQRPFEIKWH